MAIGQYIELARQLSVHLIHGYLFRPPYHREEYKISRLRTSSSALARLRAFLKEMDSGDAETLHGFHSGSSITLALLGAELSGIIYHKHVRWKGVIQHYTIFS